MGFSDSFKKLTRQLSGLPRNKKEFTSGLLAGTLTAGANPFGVAAGTALERFKDTPGTAGKAIRFTAGTASPMSALLSPGGLGSKEGRAKHLGTDKGEEPPAPGAAPAVGAGTEGARAEARRRALLRAARRFGFRQTVNTSPLGVQGQGAALGKKTLVGE